MRGLVTIQGGARQVVLRFIHGDFRLAHPVFGGVFLLAKFLLQNVLIGDGHGDLRLDLQVLILHIQHHLLDHFFRIFRAVDHVVEIGPN